MSEYSRRVAIAQARKRCEPSVQLDSDMGLIEALIVGDIVADENGMQWLVTGKLSRTTFNVVRTRLLTPGMGWSLMVAHLPVDSTTPKYPRPPEFALGDDGSMDTIVNGPDGFTMRYSQALVSDYRTPTNGRLQFDRFCDEIVRDDYADWLVKNSETTGG